MVEVIPLNVVPPPLECTARGGGYQLEAGTIGCIGGCASIVVVRALPTVPPRGISICGIPADVRMEGEPIRSSAPLLVIHGGECNVRAGGAELVLPCGVPRGWVKLRGSREPLQELGLGIRGRIIHRGRPSVYVLNLPARCSLGRETLPEGLVILATGEGTLRVGNEVLRLP
ncbi:MAG: hypothetical protein QI197_06030 [Candidatus Korarchaeota archaeon]|nr:hypothetical protein [Candidatus Korarchaeota archaeon]